MGLEDGVEQWLAEAPSADHRIREVLTRWLGEHQGQGAVLVEVLFPGLLLTGPIAVGSAAGLDIPFVPTTVQTLEAALGGRWTHRRGLSIAGPNDLWLAAQAPVSAETWEALLRPLEAYLGRLMERRLGAVALEALRRFPNGAEMSFGGPLFFTNSAWSALTGYSKEEAFGRSPRTLLRDPVAPVFDPEYFAQVESLINRGVPWQSALASRTKDGERLWQEITVVPAGRKPDGEAIVFAERRAAEHRSDLDDLLAAAFLEQRAVLRAVPDGMVVLSDDSILVCNEAFRTIVGAPAGAVLPSVVELIEPEDRPSFVERLETAAPFSPSPFRVRGPSGQLRFCDVSSVGSVRFQGSAAVIMVFRDTTEQRHSQDQRMASERLAAVGAIAASLAHEINNPLAYALANIELVLEGLRRPAGPISPEQVEWQNGLSDTLEGLQRIQSIVQDLRVMARMDRGTQEGPPDLLRIIDVAANLAANDLRHQTRLLRPVEGHAPLRVQGQESALVQAFSFLLISAARAARAVGGEQLQEIELRIHELSGTEVQVHLRHEGAPFSEAERRRLFEPRMNPVGGLSLHAARRLIRDAGGDLDLIQDGENGRTFLIRLILAEPPRPAASAPTKASADRKLRVLVVDDEPQVLTVLGRLLRNHPLIAAASGAEALQILEKDADFDAVLCDVMMPGMTGPELYQLIEARWPALAPRVVFMSGGAFTPQTTAFLAQNGDRVLEKPFQPEDVRGVLAKVAEARDQQAPLGYGAPMAVHLKTNASTATTGPTEVASQVKQAEQVTGSPAPEFGLNTTTSRKEDLAAVQQKAEQPKIPAQLRASARGEKVLGHRVATDRETGAQYMFFWKTESPFSQWHPADFGYGGQRFVTSEQWMMALKARVFGDQETLGKILNELDPKKQKELGRQVKNFSAEKWDALSFAAVYVGNALKFGEGALKERLLETRGYTLVEASPHDKIWGIGLGEEAPEAATKSSWQGTNRLGQVLSELREDMLSGKAEARVKAFIAELGIERW
ncbi:MAG: NADAR domain-containing protein [Myxococcota bacterium]